VDRTIRRLEARFKTVPLFRFDAPRLPHGLTHHFLRREINFAWKCRPFLRAVADSKSDFGLCIRQKRGVLVWQRKRTRLSPGAIKGLFRIATHWKLRDDDTRALLGGISSGSFYALKNRAPKTLDEDQLTRISLLVGIYKALNILYGQKLADAWIALPNTNPMFGGDSPLRYVKKGGIPAFLRVRQLLDARRGGR
jgi:hypothetical protein